MFEQRYELLDVLGRGGFAIVYHALDTVISREVAIKVLAPLQGPEANHVRQRFLREAAVFAGLEDPHTITMFDFGESAEGRLFMVFEYLKSEELADVIRSGRGRHPRIATHILIQLTGALREAHQKGVYHRDIKPANVLVYEYDGDPYRVKLIDFGIAKDVNPDVARLTRTGRIVGTPRYMAPEQLFGQAVGPDSDLYSLGLLGFELVAGRPAVEGTTNKDVLKRQVSEEPYVVPRELAPPGLRRILERMMAKDRRARYQTASALLDDLRAVMPEARAWVGRPGSVHPEEMVETIADDDGLETIVVDAEPDTLVNEPRRLPTESMSGAHPTPRWWLAGVAGAGVVLLGLSLLVLTRSPEPPRQAPKEATRSNIGSLLAPAEPLEVPAATADVRPPGVAADSGGSRGMAVVPPGCGRSKEPGLYEYHYDRAPRGWYVRVPKGYDPNVPHAVIMMFHRSWMDGARMLQNTRMSDVGDAHDAVIVAFTSEDTLPWQGARDTEFVLRALQAVRDEVCIDDSRLYALGDGAGGGFAERLACAMPLSAIATTAHGMWEGDEACRPKVSTARLRIYGAIDKHAPPEGGTSCVPLTGPYMSAEKLRGIWTKLYECEDDPAAWGKFPGGKCKRWQCRFAPVLECEASGGHYWPGVEPVAVDLPSCKTEDPRPALPYREVIWKFFETEGHVLRPDEVRVLLELLDW